MSDHTFQSLIPAPHYSALLGLRIRPSQLLAGANRGIKLNNTLHVPPAFYSLVSSSKSESEMRLLLDSLCYVELDR